MERQNLLKPIELDTRLRYPGGRCAKLAREGKIPHIVLPDGAIRFDSEQIAAWLSTRGRGDQLPLDTRTPASPTPNTEHQANV